MWQLDETLHDPPSTVPPSGVDRDPLRARFAGAILTPEDGAAYDDARIVFNAMFDRRPALIARARSPRDVAAALGFARERGLAVAVRGGGHSVAGYSTVDGGVVIDLSQMKRIDIDPERRRAFVEPGVTWGELDCATQEHGLATTGGRMSTTGVAGFTLGSGSGWLERLHGLACDNLVSAEVVLADGRAVVASEREHPDLFWGLRGGGGNFGVVTKFEFRLHPVGPLLTGGLVIHPRSQAPEVCRFVRDFLRDAPREVAGGAILMHAPPAPFVQPHLQGRPAVTTMAVYFGAVEEGAAVLAPLKAHAEPAVDLMGPISYLDFQAITDPGNPPGRRNYWHSGLLAELTDEAIDTLIACAATATSPASVVVMGRLGGAMADIDDDETAISGRTAGWVYHCYGIWNDQDDEPHIAWVRATERAMRPFAIDGIALNFVSDVNDSTVRRSFGLQKYQRLVALKDKYDPGNTFASNQNVRPSRLSPGTRP